MSSKKTLEEVRKLKKNQKEIHKKQVDDILYDTYKGNEFNLRLKEYKNVKTMKWFHYLISLSITIFITGISFLIGFLTKDTNKTPDYQGTGWASLGFIILIIIIMMIINWVKNKQAAQYFNDKRRRYQRTLTIKEAKLLLTNKILFLSAFLLIPVVVTTNIVF